MEVVNPLFLEEHLPRGQDWHVTMILSRSVLSGEEV